MAVMPLAFMLQAQSVKSFVDRPIEPAEQETVDEDTVVEVIEVVEPVVVEIDTFKPRQTPTLDYRDYHPVVFDTLRIIDPLSWRMPRRGIGEDAFRWLDDAAFNEDLIRQARQVYATENPGDVRYILSLLPEPPKHFRDEDVDVEKAIIDLPVLPETTPDFGFDGGMIVQRRNWLHNFKGSVQFSQAYISPNWYQGGNNNVNMLVNAQFDVKLNPAYYKKLLFETTVAYKLGLNSAPDDSIRGYSISEDLFQVNSKFGYKAMEKWYYTVTGQFKTQFLNNYKKNTEELKAAFLSPAELNLGVGMTYNTTNRQKTLTFDASVSPLSYNLKTCTNSRMDETSFGIKLGRKTVSQYGSSGECKLSWRLTKNIKYDSRFFVFTDYSYVQGDWENTLSFTINRFLSTQIYAHLRYDSSKSSDPDWKQWQFKEILSFGFAYAFASY